MKKNLLASFWLILTQILLLPTVFADSTVFGEKISYDELRNGNMDINTIPGLIKGAINFFIGIAGTISIIFIIIGAYFIMFGDIANDKSKGKDIIFKALGGFAISSLAWVIIKLILDNFG